LSGKIGLEYARIIGFLIRILQTPFQGHSFRITNTLTIRVAPRKTHPFSCGGCQILLLTVEAERVNTFRQLIHVVSILCDTSFADLIEINVWAACRARLSYQQMKECFALQSAFLRGDSNEFRLYPHPQEENHLREKTCGRTRKMSSFDGTGDLPAGLPNPRELEGLRHSLFERSFLVE
jgi:hypothetical protein